MHGTYNVKLFGTKLQIVYKLQLSQVKPKFIFAMFLINRLKYVY